MTKKLPWQSDYVRDENKMISLYIPEETKIKLKWLSDLTGTSQQKILRKVLVPAVDKMVEANLKK